MLKRLGLACFYLFCVAGVCFGAERNMIVNPNFERAYPARRLVEPNLKYIRGDHKKLPSYEGKPFMPYGWMMVPSADGACKVSRVSEGGKEALRVEAKKGEILYLRQLYIEVTPGEKYDCRVAVKGAGNVRLTVYVNTPAPGQNLGNVLTKATQERWKNFGFKKEVGFHRHLAALHIQVTGPADVLIRNARLTAKLPVGDLPERVATTKPEKDSDTLFFEDFDGKSFSVKTGASAKLTGATGGRFGRGLVTSSKEGGATTRLPIGKLPEKGTIEFWFKPAKLPASIRNYYYPLIVTTQTPGLKETQMNFCIHHWMGVVRFGFRRERYKGNYAVAEKPSGWGWWRLGTWHHFAGSWDGEVMRVYVDGVLGGVCYGKDREGNSVVHPTGQAVDLVLKAPGVIDEIRISKGLRFGPVIPVGAKAVSYPKIKVKPDAAASALKELTLKEMTALRQKALKPVPRPKASYIFSAQKAQPAWKDMGGLRMRKDYFGKGKTALDFAGFTLGSAVYWKLKGIKSGKYYIGLWTETSEKRYRTEYSAVKLQTTIFRNGWPVRFATTSEPVQVKKGLWIAELQTGKAVELKDGDEIGLTCSSIWGNKKAFLRLALYRDEPKRGHGFTGQTFGVRSGTVQRLRLVAKPEILGSGIDGDEHEAKITIANPLGFDAEVLVNWKLADYFGAPLVEKQERVKISAHDVSVISHKFKAQGEGRAYQLDVRTTPAPGFSLPHKRPREMLELSDWSKMEFMPNQNGPLTVWNHSRRDLTTIKTGVRKFVSLDGKDWERGPLAGRRVPDKVPGDIKFRRFTVPFMRTYIKLPKNIFGMWYRKKFRVPEWLRGQNLVIEVSQAICEGTIFVNGKRVGYGVGGSLPFSADITGAVKVDGENELVICVRNAIALVAPEFVDKYDPTNSRLVEENQDIYGSPRNAACLNSVYLRTAPPVRVKQAIALPDVEKKKLRVMARIENRSGASKTVEISCKVMQEGVISSTVIPTMRVTIADGAVAEVESEGPAGNLREHGPKRPALAKLIITVSENGRVVDTFAQRFGYRSFRIDGLVFNINGKPAKLLGGFQHYPHNFFEGDDGITVSRDAHGGGTPDLLDEIGKFHYKWIGLGWAQRWKKLNNAKFWDSIRKNAVETIWEHGFHPSIIGWGISNESYHYAPYIAGGKGQERHGELIYSIAQKIRETFKTPFWCIADGDEDLGGRLDFTSFHYLNQNILYGWHARDTSMGYFMDGHSHYAPDCFFLDRASQVPKHGTILKMRPDWKLGETACGDTETFWMTSQRNGVYMCAYLGDRAALSPAWQFGTARGMAWTKMSMDGYRDMEQAIITGMYWKSGLGLGAQTVTFAMPEQEIRYYSGAKFDRRLNIHDDEFSPGELEFTWRLLDEAGAELRRGTVIARSATTTLLRKRITFDVGQVAKRTIYTLAMELKKDTRRRAYEERVLDVWPKAKPLAMTGEITLYDPSGKVPAVLKKLGCQVKTIGAINENSLAGVKSLLIGPECDKAGSVGMSSAVRKFAERGGRVIILRQRTPSLLPVDTYLEKRARFSIGFVRAGEHPIMKGLIDRDFQMWNPGHVIVDGVYRKPERGNFLALVDSGHEGTLAWTSLLEVYIGEGAIVASQLPLIEKFDAEPMCAELLARMLRYLEMPVYRKTQKRLAVLGGARNGVLQRLKDIRADFKVCAKIAPDDTVALVDMETTGLDKRAGELSEWVRGGGTLMLHRARPAHEAVLEKIIGANVSIRVQPWQAWDDRQVLERRSGLTEGMNNLDFYWRPLVRGETVLSTWQVANGVVKPRGQVQYLVKAKGGVEYLFPGGLLEIPVGGGRVIINQLKWEMDGAGFAGGSPKRVISALLTNLGIRQKLPVKKPTLPKGVTYTMVDISKQANRSFRDDRDGDKVGWLDWGPGADLRKFPTGKVKLQRVPFLVPKGDKNAIVLRVNPSWRKNLSEYPDTVTIPVNLDNVAGLWFLHTGGWAFGIASFGERRINYADGTSAKIILSGANMADWNPGHDQFPDEEYTTTTVAWTSANKQYPIIRVYKTLWVNPFPGKRIVSVVITNKGLEKKQWRFMPHFGLTAAIMPEVVVAKRDPALSAKLFMEAQKLLEAKKTSAAIAKLTAAVKANPGNIGAWQTLATVSADTATTGEYRALCRRWSEAEPANYQPYNALGKFLEKKGLLKEALAAYRKSIKIEWNQPFTDRAIQRIVKKLDEK